MERVFLELVNMSISAGWLVLAILPLRLLLKKAPRWAFCALWGLVGLRLILPVSLESALSLIPSAETIPPGIVYEAEPEIRSGIPALNSTVNPIISESFAPAAGASVNPLQIVNTVAATLWIVGLTIMLLYALISYSTLRARMRTATVLEGNIYESELANSPFVLGILRPAIYLPYNMEAGDMAHVIAHERAHIARRDHLIKPVGFLLLSVYWFNPLMWLAYILLARDIEMACDQRVVKGLDGEQRRAYSAALLNCSVGRARIAACPLAFGEVSVKDRVKGVMNYKKPGFWIVAAAVLACAVAAACFLTDPEEPDLSFLNYQNAVPLLAEMESVQAIYYPVTEDGSGSILPADADAAGLAALLDGEEWRERRAPRGGLPSPGSVQFIIEDGYRITIYESPRIAAVEFGGETRYYRTGRDTYQNAVSRLSAQAPFGREYRVEEVLYDAPQYSFTYTVDNAPYYRLGEDMALHVLEDRDSDNWLHPGTFSGIELTGDNFDKYFEANGSGGWMGWKETASALREGNQAAWRLIVGEGEGAPPDGAVFFYLLAQEGGEIYLAQGYYDPEGESDPHSDDSNIRWLFKLAPEEGAEATAYSGDNSVALTRYAPGTGFSSAIQAGVPWLEIDPYEHEGVPFRVFADGEERYGEYRVYDAVTLEPLDFISPSGLAPQTYIFQKATPGRSYIVTMREEEALYCFGAKLLDYGAVPTSAWEDMTPYRSTWCVYLNPLSSAARMGDSGMEYRLGENSFMAIDRDSGEVIAMRSPLDWEWTQLAQADWEWAKQLRGDSESAFAPDVSIGGYRKPLAMELGGGYGLLNMDGALWVVETRENPRMGQYIWSIYGIAPDKGVTANYGSPERYTGDFDGDGLEDAAFPGDISGLSASPPAPSLGFRVEYGDGRTERIDIAGEWMWPSFGVADFDGDGADDLLVVPEHWGSNYGACDVFVLRAEDGEMEYFPSPVQAIEAQRELFDGLDSAYARGFGNCLGAGVVQEDGRSLLRVRMQMTGGLEDDNAAWYVDMLWQDGNWEIASIRAGVSYGGDRLLDMANGHYVQIACTGDFNGDGLEDKIQTPNIDPAAVTDSASLNVAYGDGRTLWMEIEGSWFHPPECSAGDFDGDGTDDLLVVLEHYGSNYRASEAYVYRGGEGAPALSLTPTDAIEANRERFEEGINGFSGHLGDCIGASVLKGEGKDLLRVRMLKDYDPGLGITTAWYVDMELEGSRWDIAGIHMGEAYGEDRILEYDAARAMYEWGRGKKVYAYYSKESPAIRMDLAGGIQFNGRGMELRAQEDGEYLFRRPGEEYDPLAISVYKGWGSGVELLNYALESAALEGERLAHGGSLFSPGQFAEGIDAEVLKYTSLTRKDGVSRVYTTCCVESPQRDGEALVFRFLNAVEENGEWQVILDELDCTELMDTLRFTGA